jgi:hypothetical protein
MTTTITMKIKNGKGSMNNEFVMYQLNDMRGPTKVYYQRDKKLGANT